jgi:type IV pilus assembly protein PilP
MMTARALPLIAALAGGALVAGCGGDEYGDLKQELATATKDFRGRVDPLPQVKPYEPVPYTGESLIDPFRPERIEVAQAGRPSPNANKIAEHEKRVKEPLEAFPLDAITMLGTITQEKETFALVKAGANLYRVRRGNYMGQNFGVITSIDEATINLRELVQDSGGEWVERNSALSLAETKK